MDAIIQGIKEAHRNDSTSAPNTTVAQEIKQDLKEVANFKGSRVEQLILLFCKQTRLKYSRLTDKEKHGLPVLPKNPNWQKAIFRSVGSDRI